MIHYASALYVQEKILPDLKRKTGNEIKKRKDGEPMWKVKLKNKIDLYRKEISRINAFQQSDNPSRSLKNKIKRIKKKYSKGEQ